MPETITIEHRFCGPPNSGHGGYVAGRLAVMIGGDAEVTLRQPVPLGRGLEVVRGAEAIAVRDGEALIAEARPRSPRLELPRPVGFETASRAAAAEAYVNNAFSRCFACGPARPPGDGLRIVVGDVGAGILAAPWVPEADLAGAKGRIDPVYLWAALDCPSGFAVSGKVGVPILLGRMTAHASEELEPGSRTVIMAWPLGNDGRKRFAASALFDEAGRCLGRAECVWFRPRAAF